MELLLFSRMFHFIKRLRLEEVEKKYPDVLKTLETIRADTALTEKQRQARLLQLAGHTLANCCDEKTVSQLEYEIRREWPRIAPSTIMNETIVFWLMWRYLSSPVSEKK